MERFEQRVVVRDVDPVRSGSRGRLKLQAQPGFYQTVAVARALARRGVSLSVAHHAVEKLALGRKAVIVARHVDDQLYEELQALGVQASPIGGMAPSRLRAVRRGMSMSQDQFANTYGLATRTVQNWERKPGELDAATSLLIRVIARHPALVEEVAASAPEDELQA